jgi:hypothetical protein
VQEDAESQDVPVATSFSYLIRMLAMAISSSVFGVILNEHLAKGVKASGGKITLSMLNHLSDAKTRASLPKQDLVQMENILYGAIHAISGRPLSWSSCLCFWPSGPAGGRKIGRQAVKSGKTQYRIKRR